MPILRCGGFRCKNEYQDHKYGQGMRVHNPCGKKVQDPNTGKVKSQVEARCTVCEEKRSM